VVGALQRLMEIVPARLHRGLYSGTLCEASVRSAGDDWTCAVVFGERSQASWVLILGSSCRLFTRLSAPSLYASSRPTTRSRPRAALSTCGAAPLAVHRSHQILTSACFSRHDITVNAAPTTTL